MGNPLEGIDVLFKLLLLSIPTAFLIGLIVAGAIPVTDRLIIGVACFSCGTVFGAKVFGRS